MKYKVTFTFWSKDNDFRTIIAENVQQLVGMLAAIHENEDIVVVAVEPFKKKR